MAHNDIALVRRKLEILLGMREGKIRMAKPMKTMRGIGIVPIIEKIIVQQGTAYQRCAIDAHAGTFQTIGGSQARASYRYHMVVYCHVSVLDKIAREAQTPLALQIRSRLQNLALDCLRSMAHEHLAPPRRNIRSP